MKLAANTAKSEKKDTEHLTAAVASIPPVSYTHLTLPTIYSV